MQSSSYITPWFCANAAMRKAAKFTPENPYFKITIKGNRQGDTRPRLPLNFMRKYLHNKQTVELRVGQKPWRVNVIGDVRTKLSSGWAQFEKETKLRIGDALFDVHIFRARP
ncbi:hypothetical protein JHK87_029171 [Glycine soja]|nr:hypothetical protein JHK87_029171 [Glycine soja]